LGGALLLNRWHLPLWDRQQILHEYGGKKAYQSQIEFSGKMFLLRAIVADDVDPAMVVTVYRTSKIIKYRRIP
jgi:hypothetical protein